MKFLELFKQHSQHQKIVYLNYFNFDATKEPNWRKEGEAETGTTTLQSNTLSVQLENKMVTATVSKEQIMELDRVGINAKDQAKEALRNEQGINLQKEVLTKCEEVAQLKNKYEINQDKGRVKGIRRFFWDLFGYHPEVWIDGDGFFDALQKGSNEIMRFSRVGTGDWVVIHPKAMSRFESSRDFQFELSGETALNDMVIHVGNWRYLKIFTSHLVDENQVLIGRRAASDTDPLVAIVKGEDEWLQTEIVEERSFQTLYKMGLRTPMKVFAIPGAEKSYLKFKVQYEKPGLRKWIWKNLTK